MTDLAVRTIGARIKAARRDRGIRSIRAFAELLDDPTLTESVLENVEAGRKADLPISAVLNIAYALKVPFSLLLAPLSDSSLPMDLPNLSTGLREMNPAEFDAWLTGDDSGRYRSQSAQEREDLAELRAFREVQRVRREIERERVVASVSNETGPNRVEYLEGELDALLGFLRSASWLV